MVLEMEKICKKNQLQAKVRDSWRKIWAPKIMEQCELEKANNYRLRTQMEHNLSTIDDGILHFCDLHIHFVYLLFCYLLYSWIGIFMFVGLFDS